MLPIILFLVNILVIPVANYEVLTPNGRLSGFIGEDRKSGQFYGFKSIPYAKPPIGDLRFKKSVKAEPWIGIRDATIDPEMCVQPDKKSLQITLGSEDCLYLNIYSKNLSSSKPVLVHIHGGAWNTGNNRKDPSYLMTEDIVLVLINYRLGALGFLNALNSDLEDEISANNGYKDQILAIDWVKDNIKFFGGDPLQITLMGESAGAMAIHTLLLSPLLADIPIKGILMSGSALVVMHPTFNNTAKMLSEAMGIDTKDPKKMLKELKTANISALHSGQMKLNWFDVQLSHPNYGALTVEKPGIDSLIDDYPMNLIRRIKYRNVPLLVGYDSMESLILKAMMKEKMDDWILHIPFFLKNYPEVLEKVMQKYNITSGGSELNSLHFKNDIWFKYNIYRAAKEHAQRQREQIFFFEFSAEGNLNEAKNRFSFMKMYPGACHTDELGYIFKFPNSGIPSEKDEDLIEFMVKMITNFVKTGKPTETEQWKPFTVEQPHFANITSKGVVYGTLPTDKFQFWEEIYNNYSSFDYY